MADLQSAEARVDIVLTLMFREQADQVVLSPLGFHFFKGKTMVLVGELGEPLPALQQFLRERAHMAAGASGGMLAAMGTDHPLEVLRVDVATRDGGDEAMILRRSSGKGSWPNLMLPSGYRPLAEAGKAAS